MLGNPLPRYPGAFTGQRLDWKTPEELVVHKSVEYVTFSLSAATYLVGQHEGHPACKKLGADVDGCVCEGHRTSEEGSRQVEEAHVLDEPSRRVRRPVLLHLVFAVPRDDDS